MDRTRELRHVRWLLVTFVVGLVISGATAIPLEWELNLITRWFPRSGSAGAVGGLSRWLWRVRDALAETNERHPFLAYGTDWLAFGHFAIAVVFIGPIRDPIRNIWVITSGMIICALVVPYALVFGEVRGIPMGWRLIDCLFGALGLPLLWLARRKVLQVTAGGKAPMPESSTGPGA